MSVNYYWNPNVSDCTETVDDIVSQYQEELAYEKDNSFQDPVNYASRRAELDEMGM